MSEDFYLTLPSNTGKNKHASSFRITLPKRIQLTGEWEVAITEIIYPHSWYNVRAPENIFYILWKSDQEGSVPIPQSHLTLRCSIPEGYYSNVNDLFKTMEKRIRQQHPWVPDVLPIKFQFDEILSRVTISLESPAMDIQLSRGLTYMLGYDVDTFEDISDDPGIAPHPPDMRAGVVSLYVYTDLVEHTIVGDTVAPLLRAVAVQSNFGDIVDKSFQIPHYIPVLKKDFDTIEIEIKTDQNKLLEIQFGKTIVKLHFRRRRSGIFL